jgi:NAD(P)H-quinone oxidoreductase subunit 5
VSPWFSLLVAVPPVLLLAMGLVSSGIANRHVRLMRRGAVMLMAVTCGCAVAAATMLAAFGPLDSALLSWTWPIPMNVGVYFDSLAAVMSLLISFIGLIIVRYSVRYLDGEVTQGRFLQWILITLGAVLLMVVSRNLLMFAAAWMLTSFGLHQLLTHYPDRPWAIWAARKKFLISRLGDVLLIAALALTYYCFGSFDYRDVFAGAQSLGESAPERGWLLSLIGLLFVIGAMTKSAQFPFHSWLPDTMETPTPVSALMHAGVINAGGFLVIRLSPLVSQSHLALDLLALVGAFTALLGGVVMLTQTSIKRSLAYSTIAQMGFMMLQCGLGAFSAALLHIVAHSLYKAHAFLSSGSVLESAARMKTTPNRALSDRFVVTALPAALAVAMGLWSGSAWLLGIDLASKPGSVILGLILTMALTHLVWQAFASGSWRIAAQGVAAAGLVSWLYLGGWLAIDRLLASSVSHQLAVSSPLDIAVIGIVTIGFSGVFVLQSAAGKMSHHPIIRSLYVHAANGFYLDIPARRLTARIWGGAAPTP